MNAERSGFDDVTLTVEVDALSSFSLHPRKIVLRMNADTALAIGNELAGAVWDFALADDRG